MLQWKFTVNGYFDDQRGCLQSTNIFVRAPGIQISNFPMPEHRNIHRKGMFCSTHRGAVNCPTRDIGSEHVPEQMFRPFCMAF